MDWETLYCSDKTANTTEFESSKTGQFSYSPQTLAGPNVIVTVSL
jgi:hypothetical protein